LSVALRIMREIERTMSMESRAFTATAEATRA
jgi:hypothetical protein